MQETAAENVKKKNGRAVTVAGKIFTWTMWGLLVVYCLSLLFPLYWLIMSSLKSYEDYLLHPFQFPQEWVFRNYADVFEFFRVSFKAKDGTNILYGLFPMALYSVIYTFGYSFIQVFVTALVAYVIARYQFIGRNFIYSLGIVVMIVPIVGSLPSAMYLRRVMGVYNNMFLHIITSPSTAFSGLYFLLFYAAFRNVPQSFSEAVFLDGGGHYTALFRVVLPMVVPSCVAVFVLYFLASWNDYNTFIMWLPSYPSLSVGLYLFERSALYSGKVTTPVILASFVVVIIPTCTLYLGTQGILMKKFMVGGLKG